MIACLPHSVISACCSIHTCICAWRNLYMLCTCMYTCMLHAAPGCSQCHRGITISDWRDPLDPDLDAQVIYSQFSQGKSNLIKKYLPLPEDDGNSSMRNGSTSPTSMTSSGATSLQDQDGGGATQSSAAGQSVMEDYCRDLIEVLENISWHHSQIHGL